VTWIFWVAVALIAYAYVGYPGWLWFRSWLRPVPVQSGAIEPFVSIVMVVRNEERVLEAKIDQLLEIDYPVERMELVIVSDGSTDRTEVILHQYACNPRVQVVMNQLSRGKVSGLNDALQVVQGEIVVFTDARQKIEQGALRMLVQDFATRRLAVSVGN